MPHTVAVFVGSLRAASWNRKVARALIDLAPASLTLEIIEFGHLTPYTEDLDATPPQTWVDFRHRIKPFTGVLFVTPEYNRSIPGGLKNAIDIASRPYGHSVWNAKPAAVVSCTIGALGAYGSSQHLRQSLAYLNMPCMPHPEMYLGHIDKKFDAAGTLADDALKGHLQKFITAFAAWVDKNKAG
jgi:chromate reductase